MVTYQIKYYSI